jgi:uncharacterized protein
LNGSYTLLTGASSGIGRALALQLARRDVRLAIVARRTELLESLADEIQSAGNPRPAVITADLSQRGAAAQLARQSVEALGRVDVLINNAGGGAGGSMWATGDGDPARDAFEVNYWSPLALIGALVPSMRERGRGAVVNVTSGAQVMTWPLFGAYSATKAALALGTQTLRMELEGSGVRVLEAIPGPVDTAVQGETRLIPGIDRMLTMSPLGTPEGCARAIVRALERGRSRVVYPRAQAPALVLPRLAQAGAKLLWRRTLRTLDSQSLEGFFSLNVRSGSFGDPVSREARAQWEREHAKPVSREGGI